MGHRSLPASLPSSAWILATSTAARPGLPERTIRTQWEGRAWEEDAEDAGCCGLESPQDTWLSPPLLPPHTLQPPGGPGIIARWSSRWMDGSAGEGGGTRTPNTRPADAVCQSTGPAKGLDSEPAATSLSLVPPPCLDGLDLSPALLTSISSVPIE